ncbi:MAG: hypothetical protein JXQ75_12510, partial [Phycisphaerae bacterium]|nr:hypothetical protein [Phycisphaerae bacterium]
RENSVSETPFLTVKTTGETPVPQFCHGLLVWEEEPRTEARAAVRDSVRPLEYDRPRGLKPAARFGALSSVD